MSSNNQQIESLQHLFRGPNFKEKLIESANKDINQFKRLFEMCTKNTDQIAWRAAWVLRGCLKKNDERLKSHLHQIINAIEEKEDGHQRELIKIFEVYDLDEDYEGYLFDICANIWEDLEKIPSTRITAMKFMMRVAEKYPEIKSDIKLLTSEEYIESLSPGIKRSLLKSIH